MQFFNKMHIVFHHFLNQLLERRLRGVPSQKRFSLSGVAKKLFHLARTKIFGVDLNKNTVGLYVKTLLVYTLSFPADAFLQ